jgi:hypothetical protein
MFSIRNGNVSMTIGQNGKVGMSVKTGKGVRLTQTAGGKKYMTVTRNGITMKIPLDKGGEN